VVLRDFVYLDVERLRSFVAQAGKGLLSERATGAEHEGGVTAHAGVKVPLFADLGGDTDYRYIRTSTETRSLHDHIFEEFHSHLASEGKLMELDSAWNEDEFADGQFIEVKGAVRLIDYKRAVEMMSVFPSIKEIAAKAAGAGAPPTEPEARRKAAEMRQQVKAMPIKEIGTFVRDWYGDDVRVKVYPFEDRPECMFVGRADRTFFRYAPSTLSSTYGAVINADWTALLHIHRGRPALVNTISSPGQHLDDIMEGLTEVVSGLNVSGVTFPAIAATPLAIYRPS